MNTPQNHKIEQLQGDDIIMYQKASFEPALSFPAIPTIPAESVRLVRRPTSSWDN